MIRKGKPKIHVSDEACWASSVGPGISEIDRFVCGWMKEVCVFMINGSLCMDGFIDGNIKGYVMY